jgi:hypothetical protein
LNTTRASLPTWLLGCLAALFILFVGSSLWNLVATTDFGESDFKIYWSAAYLLSRGENPYDLELVRSVQETQAHSLTNDQIIAWNPPFLFLFLLPLAWLPFVPAKFVWLIVNLVVILTAGLLLISVYLNEAAPQRKMIFLGFSLAFPAAITGLYMGQVTFLVFWGMVACLALIRQERWFWAGAALLLTTIKPHLVVLPVLYVLLYMGIRHKYQGWAGLALAGFAGLAILLSFRSDLLSNLLGETSVASARWATSTIGGLLSYLSITEAARFLIVVFIPLPFTLAGHPEKFGPEFSVAFLTLLTVPTTIFGWSYDQTILLIPIAQIFAWLVHSKYQGIVIAGIVAVTVLSYVQRVLPVNEVYYVWIPLVWWLLFGIAWRGNLSFERSYA